jgi:hypothetical protein
MKQRRLKVNRKTSSLEGIGVSETVVVNGGLSEYERFALAHNGAHALGL